MTSRAMRETVRWTTAALLLAAIVLGYTHVVHVNPTTVAMTLLLYILLLAARWGIRYAVPASFISALCFNFFFLPPIGTLTIADTQNWIAFFAFLASALIGSNLSSRIKKEAAAANQRRKELELLYDFGQRLLSTESTSDLLKAIPQNIVAAFRIRAAALYLSAGDRLYLSSPRPLYASKDELRSQLGSQMSSLSSVKSPSPESALLSLLVGVRPTGSIFVEGNLPSQETLEAMSSLIAIAIESATAVEKLARADAAHESERLRAALLDSVTHDLRTPLTSIKVSVTTLQTQPALTPAQRTELLAIIDEESDRLNLLIAQATEMAQLDAHEVHPDLAPHTARECVDRALEQATTLLADRQIEVRLPDTLPPVFVDLDLIVKVLGHLLENAAKYSAPRQPIFLSAVVESRTFLALSVADRGIGIDPTEQEMIFHKFYRGQSQRSRIQGTGMGLAISHAILDAHHGSIRVTSQPGSGSVFTIVLPLAPVLQPPR